jgi:hypothetical protein
MIFFSLLYTLPEETIMLSNTCVSCAAGQTEVLTDHNCDVVGRSAIKTTSFLLAAALTNVLETCFPGTRDASVY